MNISYLFCAVLVLSNLNVRAAKSIIQEDSSTRQTPGHILPSIKMKEEASSDEAEDERFFNGLSW